MVDMDFIGFTYNGIHSWRDLGIYRTSDGSRYNNNLTATMTDKTVDVPSGDGQYYFGTTFKNRTFTVNYAFDNLTEEEANMVRRGKNTSKASVAKNASVEEYRASTGFECLLGYLKLTHQDDRINQLVTYILENLKFDN